LIAGADRRKAGSFRRGRFRRGTLQAKVHDMHKNHENESIDDELRDMLRQFKLSHEEIDGSKPDYELLEARQAKILSDLCD
jgi:hypothetical protein